MNTIICLILADGSADERPKEPVIEEPLKPVVSHTREQVLRLSHEALNILYNQNTDFSSRPSINRTIPDSYFSTDQEGKHHFRLLLSLHYSS